MQPLAADLHGLLEDPVVGGVAGEQRAGAGLPGRSDSGGRPAATVRRIDTSASASPVSQPAAGPGRDQVRAAREASTGPEDLSVTPPSRSRAAAASMPARYVVRASLRAAEYTVSGTSRDSPEAPEAEAERASAATGRSRCRRRRSIRRSAMRAGWASRTWRAPWPVKWSADPAASRRRSRAAKTSEGPGSSVSGPSSSAYGSASAAAATTTWCRRGSAAMALARSSSASRPCGVARSLKVTASSRAPAGLSRVPGAPGRPAASSAKVAEALPPERSAPTPGPVRRGRRAGRRGPFRARGRDRTVAPCREHAAEP